MEAVQCYGRKVGSLLLLLLLLDLLYYRYWIELFGFVPGRLYGYIIYGYYITFEWISR